MFKKLENKFRLLIFPVTAILLTFLVVVYILFSRIIQQDYLDKSKQFSNQIAKNITLQLDKIKTVTDTLIKTYNLDNINPDTTSQIAINRCLNNFNLYNPNISTVYLTMGDEIKYFNRGYSNMLSSNIEKTFNFKENDNSLFFYHDVLLSNCIVYTKRLNHINNYIVVISTLSTDEIIPKSENIFINYSDIYISFNGSTPFNISELGIKEDTLVNKLHKTPEQSILMNDTLVIANNIPGYMVKLYTKQSTEYLSSILMWFKVILVLFFVIIVILCIVSTNYLVRFFSAELNKLNKKLTYGVNYIDELTENLK